MSWKLRGAQLGLAFGLLLSASAALAAGKLTYIDKFTSGSDELAVATYFDPAIVSPANKKVAILGIANGTRRISIAFGPNEWPALIALWTKTVDAQSNSWEDVGAFIETGTTDISSLKISAGPGATFLISSPARGIETYLLPTADLNRFDAAVRKTLDSLANQASD